MQTICHCHHHYFTIHSLFTHLTTLGRKKFLLDEYFLSPTLLIMQTTYHHHHYRYFTMHSLIHHSPLITLQIVRNVLLMTIFFFTNIFNYANYLPLSLLHNTFIIHLFITHFSSLQGVRNVFFMSIFFINTFNYTNYLPTTTATS